MRARFFRRMVFGALAFVLFVIFGLAGIAWTIADRFGLARGAAAIVAVFVVFAAGFMMTMMFGAMRRFAFPLGSVMDAADRVADGDYAVRVPEHGPPPMRALAHSFNTMTERLQNADRLRREVMADVAHELRTPLTVLQGRLEGLIDGVYPRDDRQITELLEETHVLSRLIDDLRTLALSDAGALKLESEPTDLVGLVRDVARSLEAEADAKSVSLNVNTAADAVNLDIDPVRIRQVFTNLLSNALRHTSSGGAVAVSITAGNGAVTAAVSDTGEGMSPEDVARMFDRFYKGPDSRGSGLGLTIAKGLVEAHGGEITASSQMGKGTTVTVTLPAAPRA